MLFKYSFEKFAFVKSWNVHESDSAMGKNENEFTRWFISAWAFKEAAIIWKKVEISPRFNFTEEDS